MTLPGLAPAGYTVTESAAPNLTNYYLTTPTADRTQSLDVTAGGTAEAHFTNTYEPYLSVTITKKVVGDMGDTTKNFSFTATLDTTQIRQGSAYTTAGDGAALTDTGFTLRSGGSVTLTHLRADQTLTLTETDPGDHTVSWQLNGDDGPTGRNLHDTSAPDPARRDHLHQYPQRGHSHRPAHRRGALPGTGRPVLAGLAAAALQGGVTHAAGRPSDH